MDFLIIIFSFLFVLGLVVLVHELGHFVVAKRAGLRVDEFGFGYPPRAYGKKIGETVYSVNWIPFGGFVKILGEDGAGEDNKRSLASQRKLVKAKIMAAGVFMNAVLTFVILTILYVVGFYPLVPGMENHPGVSRNIYIEDVVEETTASFAGLVSGDKIVSFAGNKIEKLEDFTSLAKENIDKETEIVIERNGSSISLNVVPYAEEINGEQYSRIGITVLEEVSADNLFFAPIAGFLETFRMAYLTVLGIGQFFFNLFTQLSVPDGVVGPVGIAVVSGEVSKLGFSYLMQFVAILSISLALLNLMPIPALDGGHLFILLLEKIRGKEISTKFKNTATLIGFAFMITLMIVIVAKDVVTFNLLEPFKKLFGG